MLDGMYDIAEQYTKTATSMVNGMKKRCKNILRALHRNTTEAYKDALSSIDSVLLLSSLCRHTDSACVFSPSVANVFMLKFVDKAGYTTCFTFWCFLQFLIVFLLNLIPLPEK